MGVQVSPHSNREILHVCFIVILICSTFIQHMIKYRIIQNSTANVLWCQFSWNCYCYINFVGCQCQHFFPREHENSVSCVPASVTLSLPSFTHFETHMLLPLLISSSADKKETFVPSSNDFLFPSMSVTQHLIYIKVYLKWVVFKDLSLNYSTFSVVTYFAALWTINSNQ